MPRPKTKVELVHLSCEKHTQLVEVLEELTLEQLEAVFPFEHRDRNVRDVLAHVHEWQQMMLGWYQVGMAGEKPLMPAEGYTWKTTAQLNDSIWKRYQQTPLQVIREKLDESHAALLDLIEVHTDDELFTKRYYSWTGTTSLGSYLTSSLSSHYDWALKLLRRYQRSGQ